QRGTKVAFWWRFEQVAPGESVTVRLRLSELDGQAEPEAPFEEVVRRRRAECDEFYLSVLPEGTGDEDALVARRAFAGLQWGKQLYLYDVPRWLEGDPGQPPPPPERLTGRNA